MCRISDPRRFRHRLLERYRWSSYRAFVAAAPQLKIVCLGKTANERDIWMVIASKEGASTAAALRKNGKLALFSQAGIHSGEVDGNDVVWIVKPILNLNRINARKMCAARDRIERTAPSGGEIRVVRVIDIEGCDMIAST
jgi:hypothetical protein